jgi:hypothetical protein
MRKIFNALFFVSCFAIAENNQDGSLNTYNGDGSTTNSNNNTEDRSVSNTYNGAGSSSEMPVGSAITPSYMSNGVETCLQGAGSSVQTGIIGYSRGTYRNDEHCNRRRDSLVLHQLGMKVSAIARLCQDIGVWKAMFVAGTPCPILSQGKLVVGKRAFLVMKRQPEIYIPDYNHRTEEYYKAILGIGEADTNEDTQDITSISGKFRRSIK